MADRAPEAQPVTGRRPVVLCILDGWGARDPADDHAPHLAETPVFDRLMASCSHAFLDASGEDVGLPAGQIGNSEVGHTNIGAGRVVWMDLPRIDRAIADGSFAENAALERFAGQLRAEGKTAHILGLASPGGVHSHQRHIAAAAAALSAAGVPIALHLITDGRDVPPKSARSQVARLLEDIAGLDNVRVATVMGRFFALDRDKRWDRVADAVASMREQEGHEAPDALAAIDAAYARGETDEFIAPTCIVGPDGAHADIAEGDGLFCINFRADRAREILGALLNDETEAFEQTNRHAGHAPFGPALGMVSYSETLDKVMDVMFPKEDIPDTLGEVVARAGRTQLRLAETEKYPHVTFFLNGGAEAAQVGERRHMAPSPKVRTYDLAPEMAAAEVAEVLAEAIRARTDLIVVNFANPDMVGHTGSLEAAIAACEAVDRGLGQALEALEAVGGAMIVTADHGNCEQMHDPETGGPHTAHTLNRVPVILVERGEGAPGQAPGAALADGRLADLAPTVLALVGIDQPAAMTGRSLLRER
ncbi:MAG: 2,3-bisphosphoglycerate-independent phosphoglycerate mutase [Pseudomonadota bacterium]